MENVEIVIRIELRGTPSSDVYQALHTYMVITNRWERTLTSDNGQTVDLPHAMYSGFYDASKLFTLSTALRDKIRATIWPNCIVLVMALSNWAEAHTI